MKIEKKIHEGIDKYPRQTRTSQQFNETATDTASLCDNYFRMFTAFTEEQRSCVLLSQPHVLSITV